MALLRGALACAAIWVVGALVVVGVFSNSGASSRVRLEDGSERAQALWLGSHAFVACAATLVGGALTAYALCAERRDSGKTAWLLTVFANVIPIAIALAILMWTPKLGAVMTASILGAVIIGSTVGATFGAWRADPLGERAADLGARANINRGTQGWGSRS